VCKKVVKYGLIIALNAVFFGYLYRWFQESISWDAFIRAIFYIPYTAIFSAFTMGLMILFFYAARLAYLSGKGLHSSFWVVSYGFGTNNILPFRIGDILKLYFARKYFNFSAAKLLFIKVMEKFFDLTLLFFIGGGAVFFEVITIGSEFLALILFTLIAVLVSSVTIIVLIRRETKWLIWIRRYDVFNHLLNIFEEVVTNLSIKKALGVTIIIWIMTVVMMYAYYNLALPDFKIGWGHAFSLVFVTTLSLGVPSSPGALGVFEAAVVLYLTSFLSVPAEIALASALVLHLLLALPQIALMVVAVIAGKLHISARP
jgi:glycosyltransferase 2 family protein